MFQKIVIISPGLPHIFKTESSLGRLLLTSLSWKCSYFLRNTTHFASLPFCCVALVDANLTKMSLSPKDCHTTWTPSRHWGGVCFHQCHVRVVVSVGWLHNVQADVLTRSAACCQLNKTVYVVLSWQRCMGPRSWCIAAGASAVRFLCLVVRDSRMWCPHDIGRDSWVWG